ncbi:MAG: hypothetical protein ABL936_26480, partial [Aestuariivirga sp.]
MTRRILLGWEFGGGFGHIVRLREIARNIGETQSCEFLFALRKPQNGIASGLPDRSVVAVPAPKWPAGFKKPPIRGTYGAVSY